MMVSDGQRGLGAPIYVLASQGNSFSETLSAAIGFRFDEHISFRFFVQLLTRINSMPRRDDSNRLTRVLNAVEKSAFSYMQLYGRPVVIVIDGVDWLLKYAPSTFDRLQVGNVPHLPAPRSTAFESEPSLIRVCNIGYIARRSRRIGFPDIYFTEHLIFITFDNWVGSAGSLGTKRVGRITRGPVT